MNEVKKVFMEPSWYLPLEYRELISNPPQGYQLFTLEGAEDAMLNSLRKLGLANRLAGQLVKWGMPINLIKSYLKKFKKLPPGTDLTLALNHLVFRNEPWVLNAGADGAHILIGSPLFYRQPFYIGILRRQLLSPWCRKIFVYLETRKEALVETVGEELRGKVDVVYPAVPAKAFQKNYTNGKIKLLFVNSANFPEQFYGKGGGEALEAFVELRRRHDNLEFVVRSDIPVEIKQRFQGVPGLRLIEDVIPWTELEREFQEADIFILPAKYVPAKAFIDAMSYELPVVTQNAWGNAELVKDGVTGFVVPSPVIFSRGIDKPKSIRESREDSKKWDRAIKTIDRGVVEALVQKIGFLIENPELRQRMGKAGRREVEQGRFSIVKRNEALKRIFDEATMSSR